MNQVHYSTERVFMERILGKILASAMMCAATGGDPETESRKCWDEIMGELYGEKKPEGKNRPFNEKFADFIAGMPLCIRAEHKAGWDKNRLEVYIKGHPITIRIGAASLLETVALEISKKEDKDPAEIIREICGDAIRKIYQGGV